MRWHTVVCGYHKTVCTKVDPGRKIPCRTGKSNMRQRRAGPTLYQLSYIPAPIFCHDRLSSQCRCTSNGPSRDFRLTCQCSCTPRGPCLSTSRRQLQLLRSTPCLQRVTCRYSCTSNGPHLATTACPQCSCTTNSSNLATTD